jgi:hypothetical protein
VGASAELIADGGELAASDDFFRSPAFHRAEGVTHTLRVSTPERSAAVAVIVRDTPGADRQDAVSAYGYPGALVEGAEAAPAAADVDWTAAGLVSLFARDRLGEPLFLADATERGRVLIHEPTQPRAVRRRLAEQIRQNERRGYAVRVDAGPESEAGDRAAFLDAYTETMRAAGAGERYLFDRAYIDAVLEFERSWLLVARRQGGEGVAGAIAAASDDHLHYFLGGTAESARADSPFKNVVSAMLDLADELALPLNLGGGLEAGDGLERFKRGFANADAPFHAHEVVCDPEAYSGLVAASQEGNEGTGSGAAGFFPAYRGR